jgi:hypothetical protein
LENTKQLQRHALFKQYSNGRFVVGVPTMSKRYVIFVDVLVSNCVVSNHFFSPFLQVVIVLAQSYPTPFDLNSDGGKYLWKKEQQPQLLNRLRNACTLQPVLEPLIKLQMSQS